MKTQTEIEEGCEKCDVRYNLNTNMKVKVILCPTCQALLQQNKEFIELIKNIKNPYPEDIFPKLTELELDKVNALLEQVLNFPLDRLSAELMRRARDNLKDEIKSKLIGEQK